MKFLLTSLLLSLVIIGGAGAQASSESNDARKVRQRFSPVYGGERESDQIIEFIAQNLVLELDSAHLARLDGMLVVTFSIDSLGAMHNYRIRRSFTPGIDYAILVALRGLPHWGVPPRENGRKSQRNHQIVFSFGSYNKGAYHYGYHGDKQHQKAIQQANAQKEKHLGEQREKSERWDSFTNQNSRLEYDTQQGLWAENQKPDQSTLIPQTPTTNQPQTPTIRLSE